MTLLFWAFGVTTSSVYVVSFPFCYTKIFCCCKIHSSFVRFLWMC